jgi:hypothetical protein
LAVLQDGVESFTGDLARGDTDHRGHRHCCASHRDSSCVSCFKANLTDKLYSNIYDQ